MKVSDRLSIPTFTCSFFYIKPQKKSSFPDGGNNLFSPHMIYSGEKALSFEECAVFANQHPVCAVATVDGDQPRVRFFLMWYADGTGFYFHTGKMKQIYRQLQQNPKVELCFYDPTPPEQGGGKMLRVTGRVEWKREQALVNRLLAERP